MDMKDESISDINNGIKNEQARSEALKGVGGFEELGQHLVHTMVTALVDDEDSVKIDVMVGEQTTVFEIRVARPDLGRVIGKKGVIATSIRKIVNSFSVKHSRRAVVEIIE